MNTPKLTVTIFIVVMVLIIVAVDFLSFKDRFWERLIVNVGIVLVFIAIYMRFFK